MIYEVRHRTDYTYTAPVALSHHLLHLEPRTTHRQQVHAQSLIVEPFPVWGDRRQDAFGNPVRAITIDREHRTLAVESRATVEVVPPSLPEAAATAAWETIVEACGKATEAGALGAARFAHASPFTPADDALEDYVRQSFRVGRPILEAALDLNHRVFSDFAFDPTATTLATPVAEVFRLRCGVCQDFAHLMLAGLRALGLPARYVSGYLLTHPPAGQERMIGADVSHAWVAVWTGADGWIDLDPTNDLLATDGHITLGWGRDYGDVSPIVGVVYGGGGHELAVAVDVLPQPAETARSAAAAADLTTL
ncbi:MAG: transglutaminase family protein [Pseudomonadota bacterium]